MAGRVQAILLDQTQVSGDVLVNNLGAVVGHEVVFKLMHCHSVHFLELLVAHPLI